MNEPRLINADVLLKKIAIDRREWKPQDSLYASGRVDGLNFVIEAINEMLMPPQGGEMKEKGEGASMTFAELYKAHEEMEFPTVLLPARGWYEVRTHAKHLLVGETEAALICARLLALLPESAAKIAIELSEILRADASK